MPRGLGFGMTFAFQLSSTRIDETYTTGASASRLSWGTLVANKNMVNRSKSYTVLEPTALLSIFRHRHRSVAWFGPSRERPDSQAKLDKKSVLRVQESLLPGQLDRGDRTEHQNTQSAQKTICGKRCITAHNRKNFIGPSPLVGQTTEWWSDSMDHQET